MPSSELLAPLRGPLTRLGLISQECFNELFVKYNYSNAACLKAFLSKGLGFAIVAGSSLVKLPQVFKLMASGSAEGLSFLGVMLELMAVTFNGGYSYASGFPFSAYGEAVFLSLQTSIIAFLVLIFGGSLSGALLFTVLYGSSVYALITPGLVPAQVLWFGQASNIPMVLVGKLIQIMTNFRNGHTGQLSAITVFLLALGSLARIFTSIQETGDQVIIATHLCSSVVNCILSLQIIWYWNATKKAAAIKKKRN